jgi:hypothetical protein
MTGYNYTTSELIEELRHELTKIVPMFMIFNEYKTKMFRNAFLSDKKLSLILCGYGNRFKRIQRNIRTNPEFKIALDELKNWEENIKSIFSSKGEKAIKLINKYRDLNRSLPVSRTKDLKVLNYHPNLKLNFFEKIDSKEKAYWLGLLWAEVYLGERGHIRLELNSKDEILIDRFCNAIGLDTKYKKYRTRIGLKGLNIYVRITFRNVKIQNDLYRLGYIKSSEKSTKFPSLDSR